MNLYIAFTNEFTDMIEQLDKLGYILIVKRGM